MGKESKICQNCKRQFEIEAADFLFYEKIKVSPPTWCPECRMVRRMMWRNERSLYRRKCDATEKEIISMFDPKEPHRVFNYKYWWSDNWDQMAEGREYDFSKPFFLQFRDLLEKQPLPSVGNSNAINSDYGNHNTDIKNCYLVFASARSEDVAYADGVLDCKDSYDLYVTKGVERGYELILSTGMYQVLFSQDSNESLNSYFLRSCVNMVKSFACVNLKSKRHFIFNKPCSEEEYEEEISRFDLGSFINLVSKIREFENFSLGYPRRYASVLKSQSAVGDNIVNSKNIYFCFDIYGNVENSKYISHAVELKDSYDAYGAGIATELVYEGVDNGVHAVYNRFAVFTHSCRDVYYTYACHNSSHLFGCVGIRNKQYCILNKQYSKEEYEMLVPQIIRHMQETPYIDSQRRMFGFGEFFPPEISPFTYNESIAQQYFPIAADVAYKMGYRWKGESIKNYDITLPFDKLPDHIHDIDGKILDEVLGCAHRGQCIHQCTTAFKIIPQELEFYRKMNLPLPRLCPNCRHYERLAKRNPPKLWHRKCHCSGKKSENEVYENMSTHFHGKERCPNEFETSYAPERPEIVYCEQCYQAEVV